MSVNECLLIGWQTRNSYKSKEGTFRRDERIVNWRIKIKRDITIAQKKHTDSSSLVLYLFPMLSLCFCFEHCVCCALLFAGIYFACNLPALNVSVV